MTVSGRRALLAFAAVCGALLPCSVALAAPGKPVITSGPLPWMMDTSATFNFDSTGADSYTCILDSAQDSCSPPFTYASVPGGEGAHSFQVVAFDSVGDPGNPSEPSEFYNWTIDLTDPNLPGGIVAEATSPLGAAVGFAANDNLDPSPALSCPAHPSGSTFSLGTTTVNCTATDAAGNSETGSFDVTVRDTTPPTLNPHADVVRQQQSSQGAVVVYTRPLAHDAADATPSVVCNPAPNTLFPIGSTQVTCTATDDAGLTSAPVTFMVIVQQGAVPGAPGITANVGPLTNSSEVEFQLALEPGASAECSLDGPEGPGSFAPCSDAAPQTYSGLEDGGYVFTVKVTNGVGNISQAVFAWTVDRTGPVRVAGFSGRAGSHLVRLRWTKPIDLDYARVRIWRKRASASHWKRLHDRVQRTAFTDRTVANHVRYLYRIRSLDGLGNGSTPRQLSAWPTPIFSPRYSAIVHSPPAVDWNSVRNADYFNMQVWRDGRKILSVWPIGSRYQLRSSWTFNGKPHLLVGGRVTVYVWAGFGRKAAANYGPLFGQTRFTLG